MKPRRMTFCVEFAPLSSRKAEHELGETQAVIGDALDELRPVAKRLKQRREPDAAAVELAITALQQATRRLGKLTRYAKD